MFTPTTVFFYALLTAIATGLGAIPFFVVKDFNLYWLGVTNAIASGLMLTASFSLIFEGAAYDMNGVLWGVILGLIFIVLSHKILNRYDNITMTGLNGLDARKAVLLLAVMTLHSFTEGVGVGVSFGGGRELGIFITAAIALHNIPEGLAISLVMIPKGMKPWVAVLWCIFSSLPQPLMAVPAFMFVEAFTPFLPVGLGFAAGAMIWLVFAELVHDAIEDSSTNTVGIVVTLSVVAMFLFQSWLR